MPLAVSRAPMPSSMFRCAGLALFSMVVLALLTPAAAHAQTTTNVVVFSRVMRVNNPRESEVVGTGISTMDPIGLRDCACERWQFEGSVNPPAGTSATQLEWWVGTSPQACASETGRRGGGRGMTTMSTTTCWQLPTDVAPPVPIAAGSASVPFFLDIPARWLVDPINGQCVPPGGSTATTGTLYLTGIVHPPEDMSPSSSFQYSFSRSSPQSPTNVTASAQEGAASIGWSYGTVTVDGGQTVVPSNIRAFWVLCLPNTLGPLPGSDAGLMCEGISMLDAGADASTDASTDAATDDATDDAGAEAGAEDAAMDAGVGMSVDAGDGGGGASACTVNELPAGFDPNNETQFRRFACAGPLPTSSLSTTIEGLNNGIGYRFVVVAQDNAGNRSLPSALSDCTVPELTTDFWEHYRNSGGRASGGFCAVRPGVVGACGFFAVAGGALAAMLVTRRQKSRRGRDTQ